MPGLISGGKACGKVERFHQTLKKFLERNDAPQSISELQVLLDRFVVYYNSVRPHRALGRRTPAEAYEARTKARPSREPVDVEGYRVRHDKVDDSGKVTLRYAGRLYHLGVGRPYKRTRVVLLVAGKEVRVLNERHRLIRALTLDPARSYQPQK
jgi:hypothetical protein